MKWLLQVNKCGLKTDVKIDEKVLKIQHFLKFGK